MRPSASRVCSTRSSIRIHFSIQGAIPSSETVGPMRISSFDIRGSSWGRRGVDTSRAGAWRDTYGVVARVGLEFLQSKEKARATMLAEKIE